MKALKAIIIAIVGITLIAFALSNRTQITLSLFPLPFEIDISVFLLIFLVLIIGVLMGGSVILSYAFSCRRKVREETMRAIALEQEVRSLKAASDITRTINL